jgi:hypothetical protein
MAVLQAEQKRENQWRPRVSIADENEHRTNGLAVDTLIVMAKEVGDRPAGA